MLSQHGPSFLMNGPYGSGGCAVSIIPKDDPERTVKRGRPVGMNVDNVDCEFHGVILAPQTTVDLLNDKDKEDSDTSKLFILTDCQSAVEIVVNRTDTRYRHEEFLEMDNLCLVLKNSGVEVYITWIPAHVGIKHNEEADKLAKEIAARVESRVVEADNSISVPAALRLAKEIAINTWQRRWDRAEHGHITRLYIPSVTDRILWLDRRCVGISYVRLLLDNTTL